MPGLLLACFINIRDVGEEVVALCFGHCEAQLPGIFKHPDQNLQAQQIGVLRRDHLKYCLQSGGGEKRLNSDWAFFLKNKKQILSRGAKQSFGCKLGIMT